MDGMVIIGHRSSKSTFCANNNKETLYYQSRQSLLTIDLHPSYCDTWVFQVGATSELGTYLVIVMFMVMMLMMMMMDYYGDDVDDGDDDYYGDDVDDDDWWW